MATSSAPNSSPTSYNSPASADSMSVLLAQNWWAVAIRGACAVIFGLIALFWTGPTILSLILFFAAYMLVDGVFGIVAAVRAARRNERWGLLVLEGIADIAVGVIALMWPGLTVLAFVLMMAAWSLVTGVLMVVAAFKLHPTYGRGWLIFSGVVSVLFGIALAVAPAHRSRGADMVARSLCARLRRRAPCARVQAAQPQGRCRHDRAADAARCVRLLRSPPPCGEELEAGRGSALHWEMRRLHPHPSLPTRGRENVQRHPHRR